MGGGCLSLFQVRLLILLGPPVAFIARAFIDPMWTLGGHRWPLCKIEDASGNQIKKRVGVAINLHFVREVCFRTHRTHSLSRRAPEFRLSVGSREHEQQSEALINSM